MIKVNYPIALSATFIWIGFVCAISFMEAWLKFKAPGVNLTIGLGIGRLVFGALNKVEWILAISILLNLFFSKNNLIQAFHLFFAAALLIVVLQTIYALPVLDHRAEMQINGKQVPYSNLHLYYVIMEFIKVICLLIFGIKSFKKSL